jgi:hypothetical protein
MTYFSSRLRVAFAGVARMAARARRVLLLAGLVFAALPVLGVVGVAPASAAPPSPGTLLASLDDGGFTGNAFGYSVAVDGGTAVVGAPESNGYQGAVYVYTKVASGWVQTVTLANPPGANFYFGSSVAIDGPTIVVGASSQPGGAPGAAYVYTRGAQGSWQSTPTLTLNDPAVTNNDLFGASVAIDGPTIVVGAPYTPFDFNSPNPLEGAAYVYTASGNGWRSTPTATLHDPAASAYDLFGASVAVEKNVVAVGTSNGNAAYLYVQGSGNSWPASPTTTMTPPTPSSCFGCSVALDEDTTLVVGAEYSNAVYIYPKTPGGWSSPTKLGPPGGYGSEFGVSVAVDNGKLVVGDDFANTNGMAYEFIKGPGGWPTTASASYADQVQAGMDRFGGSVAVQGNVTVIGAWFTYGSQYGGPPPLGWAYIFNA